MALQRSVSVSVRQAAKDKNPELFRQALALNESFGTKRPVSWAQQNEQFKMNYYQTTREAEAYAAVATNFVVKYLDTQKIDSLREVDRRSYEVMMKPYQSGRVDSTAENQKNHYTMIKRGGRMISTSRLAGQYNNAAWGFYELVSDKTQLEKALTWSQKSLDLNRSPSFLDTYAHLLYKLGRQPEAVRFQQEAVTLEKKKIAAGEEGDAKSREETLEKIKNKTL